MSPTDKGSRATLKAAEFFSTIYDASYFSCIQIEGDVDAIITTLVPFLSPHDGNRLRSKRYEAVDE